MTDPFDSPAGPGAPLLEVIGAGAIGSSPLPDDPPPEAGGLRWAPGALAGVLGHHTTQDGAGVPVDPVSVQVVAVVELRAAGRLDRSPLDRLVRAFATAEVDVGHRVATGVVDLVRAEPDPNRVDDMVRAVRDLARWLIDTSSDRRAVAVGIALARVLPDRAGRTDALVTLGRHEALAGDAVRALRGLGAAAVDPLFFLARELTGWGRIEAVEALAGVQRPDIRRWMITEGFRNTVTWGYLALLVARAADLAGHLDESDPDDEVLAGARDLLTTLLEPSGPSGDITDYPDAAAVVLRWLELMERRGPARMAEADLGLLQKLLAVSDPASGSRRLGTDNGFTAQDLESMRSACIRLLTHPAARDTVLRALDTGTDLAVALRTASTLGVDPFPAALRAIRAAPWDTATWYGATQCIGGHGADLVAAAQELLPVDGVTDDPRSVIGPAPGAHMGVTFLLQHLIARSPGLGWEWVRPLLRSPLPGIRSQAFTAVTAWPSRTWPAAVLPALQQAAAQETEDKLRARFERALAGV